MGAGDGVIAKNKPAAPSLYAPIIVETDILKPSREQRRALYTTWPREGTAGQRPRTMAADR